LREFCALLDWNCEGGLADFFWANEKNSATTLTFCTQQQINHARISESARLRIQKTLSKQQRPPTEAAYPSSPTIFWATHWTALQTLHWKMS
jgi:hypothetical protein